MRSLIFLPIFLASLMCHATEGNTPFEDESAEHVNTPYVAQKVLYEFYFNNPNHINQALFWVRSLMNPLTSSPYDYAPDDLDIKVVIHGTELVALAKHNYPKYQDAVERMRYYAELGVEFRVCGLAAQEFDYDADDFYDFVTIVPSAMPEMVHWQTQGYGLIKPEILEKRFSIEEIR